MKSLLQVYESEFGGFKDSRFSCSTGVWTAEYLYNKASELGLKPEKIKLRHLDLYNYVSTHFKEFKWTYLLIWDSEPFG